MVPWPLSEVSYGALLGVMASYLLVVLALAVLGLLLRATALRVVPRPIAGSHVVITGGSEGIGLAIGLEAARQGARVTIMARSVGKLEKAVGQLNAEQAANPRASSIACDVTDAAGVAAALAKAEALAPIDFLICGAGAAYPVGSISSLCCTSFNSTLTRWCTARDTFLIKAPKHLSARCGSTIWVACLRPKPQPLPWYAIPVTWLIQCL